MIDLATDALATYRLTRLVSADLITLAPRNRIIRALYAARGDRQARDEQTEGAPAADTDWTGLAIAHGPDAPKLAQLIVCRWCASIWIAAAVTVARHTMPRQWAPVARLLACASAAGLLAARERTEPG